jgi:hypothetical protein
MRRKSKYVIPDPNLGTTRLKRVFAWSPTHIDGNVVWLEHYEILQAFLVFEYKIILDSESKTVKVSEWKDISKRLMT